MENGTQHAFARRGSDQGLATWQQRFAAWEGGRGMRTSDPKERVRADIGVFCLERMEGGAEGGVQIPVAKEHVRAHWAYGWARHGRVVGVEEGRGRVRQHAGRGRTRSRAPTHTPRALRELWGVCTRCTSREGLVGALGLMRTSIARC